MEAIARSLIYNRPEGVITARRLISGKAALDIVFINPPPVALATSA